MKKKIVSILTILIYITLLIFLLMSDKILSGIFSDKTINIIVFTICIFIFIANIVRLCRDTFDPLYTSSRYIVWADILSIIAFSVFCYFAFKNYNNSDDKIMSGSKREWAGIIFSLSLSIRDHFRSSRYQKKE